MDNYNKEEPDNNLYISTWITLSERHFKPKHPPPTSLRQALEHYPYVCVWDMAAHVPVPLYLGYVCLCLLSSWHDGAGTRAAPSQQGRLWWLTGHANGLSLHQKPPGGAERPREDDKRGPWAATTTDVRRREQRHAEHHSPTLLWLIRVTEWSLRKYGATVLKAGSVDHCGTKGIKKNIFCPT